MFLRSVSICPPGGSMFPGVYVLRGLCSQGNSDPPLPGNKHLPETTKSGGTHPTGMLSSVDYRSLDQLFI